MEDHIEQAQDPGAPTSTFGDATQVLSWPDLSLDQPDAESGTSSFQTVEVSSITLSPTGTAALGDDNEPTELDIYRVQASAQRNPFDDFLLDAQRTKRPL